MLFFLFWHFSRYLHHSSHSPLLRWLPKSVFLAHVYPDFQIQFPPPGFIYIHVGISFMPLPDRYRMPSLLITCLGPAPLCLPHISWLLSLLIILTQSLLPVCFLSPAFTSSELLILLILPRFNLMCHLALYSLLSFCSWLMPCQVNYWQILINLPVSHHRALASCITALTTSQLVSGSFNGSPHLSFPPLCSQAHLPQALTHFLSIIS